MKKLIYLLSLIVLLQSSVFSQTVIISENFESDLTGWEFEGNWFHEPGYIFMYYHPITNDYDFWVTTPQFDIPESGGELIINHFIDVFAVNVTNEKCEISLMFDNQEEVVWQHDLTNGSWGDIFGTNMELPLDGFEGKTVQLKFRSYGAKSNALWGWFIFNMDMSTIFDYDLAALQLIGPANLNPNQEGNWMLQVKNLGLTAATQFDVKLHSYKAQNHIAAGTFNGNINPGETGNVPITWTTAEIHNTVLYAVIEDANDQFSKNDKSSGHFLRIEPDQGYSVFLWDNDNGSPTIKNPETGILQRPTTTIENALQKAGIFFTKSSILPTNLSHFDVILATMGPYCLS